MLLQNIEYSCLCETVGPCWLSIFYTVESQVKSSHIVVSDSLRPHGL